MFQRLKWHYDVLSILTCTVLQVAWALIQFCFGASMALLFTLWQVLKSQQFREWACSLLIHSFVIWMLWGTLFDVFPHVIRQISFLQAVALIFIVRSFNRARVPVSVQNWPKSPREQVAEMYAASLGKGFTR